MTVIENAYAKINYFLSVGGPRPDGYHEIETIMQTISLCDRITVTCEEGEGILLQVFGNDHIPCDHRNLAYRAAEVFHAHYEKKNQKSLHVEISIEKQIPVAGGLAGGSADAAAVLRGMNICLGNPFSTKELMDMANEFGSDIAFCVLGGIATCTGRGEMVKAEGVTPTYHFLVANSGEQVSTKDAYTLLDAREGRIHVNSGKRCLAALQMGSLTSASLLKENTFEEFVLPACPIAQDMLAKLQEVSTFSQMSGSGSTVFAVFDSAEEAQNVQKSLPFPTRYAHSIF